MKTNWIPFAGIILGASCFILSTHPHTKTYKRESYPNFYEIGTYNPYFPFSEELFSCPLHSELGQRMKSMEEWDTARFNKRNWFWKLIYADK